MIRKYICLICFFTRATTYINIVIGLELESIVAGGSAESDDILFQASLIVKGTSADQMDAPCAAAAVDPNHLVSIAGCFTDDSGRPYDRWYEVKAGEKNLLDNSMKIFGVDKIYIPSNFNWQNFANNIAVIKLNESMDFSLNSNFKMVDLPKSKSSYKKKIALLSGYGSHIVEGPRDWHLRYLPVRVMKNSKCMKFFSSLRDTELCGLAMPEQKNIMAGACLGDLGGLLVFENTLIGVLSRIHPRCDDTQVPARYTRVSSFNSFIESVLDGTPPEDARVDTEQINRLQHESSNHHTVAVARVGNVYIH